MVEHTSFILQSSFSSDGYHIHQCYLSGIRLHIIALGGSDLDFSSMPGFIIYFVVSKNSRTLSSFTALPAYYYASSSLYFVMTSGFYSNNDRQLWWSSCILAFFGILWASEYTAPTTRTSIPASTQFLLVPSGSAPITPMWRFLLSFHYCSVRSWLHHSYWLHS